MISNIRFEPLVERVSHPSLKTIKKEERNQWSIAANEDFN